MDPVVTEYDWLVAAVLWDPRSSSTLTVLLLWVLRVLLLSNGCVDPKVQEVLDWTGLDGSRAAVQQLCPFDSLAQEVQCTSLQGGVSAAALAGSGVSIDPNIVVDQLLSATDCRGSSVSQSLSQTRISVRCSQQ